MKPPPEDIQRQLAQRWKTTGPALERIRAGALRGMPYDWVAVDELLQLGEGYDGPARIGSGMVEMQRYFSKARPSSSDQ
jgi:hypothetical protein